MAYNNIAKGEFRRYVGDFAHSLLNWYDRVKRDHPWRRKTDPYAILVSELMLQQTQIDTVLRYYDGFLERFPDLESLASASEDEVLTAWKGLGYYRRARHLHGAVKTIVTDYGGEFPNTYDQLIQLPGIGPYTAAAMSSIAFGKPHAVVDGNVLRVAARLFEIDQPVDKAHVKRTVQNEMDQLISRDRPGDFNQAMMELGQSICTLRTPMCDHCPVGAWCQLKGRDDVTDYPVTGRKVKQQVERRRVFVIVHNGFIRMRKRPGDGLLGGMWEFVNVKTKDDGEIPCHLRMSDIDNIDVKELGTLTHRFSHLIWEMELYRVELSGGVEQNNNGRGEIIDEFLWVPESEVETKALPTVMQKVWQRARE